MKSAQDNPVRVLGNDDANLSSLGLQKTVEDTPSEEDCYPDGMTPNDNDDAEDDRNSTHLSFDSPNQPVDQANARKVVKKRTHPWDKWEHLDEENQDWWFASTAIPLLAATIAPLANVFSIAALVSWWRTRLISPDGLTMLKPSAGIDIRDPTWVYGTNLTSLICGYVGNLFLFLNFTNRIPYIIALPATIILWFTSTIILTAIQICMNEFEPPGPNESYTQAFWYGVIASVLYLICAVGLMGNMVGFFLGHYPSHFNLTNAQRTLILQTFLFFIWMAGGAGVFSRIQQVYGGGDDQWNFAQALYFCDVTILTIGFGDYTPNNDIGRGFVLPFAIGGIIMLGLVISSITTFASEMTATNVYQKRIDRERTRTLQRTQELSSDSVSLEEPVRPVDFRNISISAPLDRNEPIAHGALQSDEPGGGQFLKRTGTAGLELVNTLARTTSNLLHTTGKPKNEHHHQRRRHSLLVLREEKQRFDEMRKIQAHSERFKRWSSLIGSMTMLLLLWLVGAVAFWRIERDLQGWTYFDALYFAYVSLLTIGFGDFTPQTNAGRPFFVVWSLLAVPSITILISDLAHTVVSGFNDWTNSLADFTLLAKEGIWADVIRRNPWLVGKLESRAARKEREKRLAEGFELGPDPDDEAYLVDHPRKVKTIQQLAMQGKEKSDHQLAKKLATTIKEVASHVKDEVPRKYEYTEWVEFTELIRFTRGRNEENEEDDEIGLIEWDWIGSDGPIMSDSEPVWLMERLCESMSRYVRKQARMAERLERNRKSMEKEKRPKIGSFLDTHHEHEEEEGSREHGHLTKAASKTIEATDYAEEFDEKKNVPRNENDDDEKDARRPDQDEDEDEIRTMKRRESSFRQATDEPPQSPEEMSAELDGRLAKTGLFG